MGYNEIASIRSTLNMSASTPSDSVITNWQTMIDAIIEGFNDSPDTTLAAALEMSRLSIIYSESMGAEPRPGRSAPFGPLTNAEKEMLSPVESDTQVDSIPMNGKRSSEIY